MRQLSGGFRDLFHTFRIALDPRKMSLAFVALGGSAIGLGLILSVFTFAADQWAYKQGTLKLSETFAYALNHVQWAQAADRLEAFLAEHLGANPLGALTARSGLARRAADIVDLVVPWRSIECAICCVSPRTPIGWGCLLIGLVWYWFVWAGFGGAIARIAAVEIAKDERIELAEAVDYATQNYRACFWAPTAVALGIGFFAFCNVAAGFLLRGVYFLFDNRLWDLQSPLLDSIAHGAAGLLLVLGFPLALLSGFLMVLLGIGLAAGWPLMLPAMAAEGTDAFDAVSRAFSYVFARPWRYLASHAIALLYAVPCVLFVMGFSCAFSCLAMATGGAGMGSAFTGFGNYIRATLSVVGIGPGAPFPADPADRFFGWILSGMMFVLLGFAVSYIASFLLSSWSVIYFGLRRAVDGTGMTEVYEEESEGEVEPGPSEGAPSAKKA